MDHGERPGTSGGVRRERRERRGTGSDGAVVPARSAGCPVPSGVRRPVPALLLGLVPALLLAATPAGAQQGEADPAEAREATAEPTSPPAAGPAAVPGAERPQLRTDLAVPPDPTAPPTAPGWIRSSDLPYLGVFFGSLALVKPLERVDGAIGGGDTDGRGADATLASAGHVAGDLFVDLGAAGATALVGWITGSGTVTRVGLRSLEALVAVDALTTLFKVGIGRQRPYASPESDRFDPFETSTDYASFPSGHTSHAFVLAATVSREVEAGWVPWVAYPLAGVVGVSRIAGGSHWPTDVAAGAALGLFTARVLGRIHDDSRPGASVTAAPTGDGVAVGVSLPDPAR